VSARLGIVDQVLFQNALVEIKNSDQVPLIRLMRTVTLEAWLRVLRSHGLANGLVMQTLNELDCAAASVMAQS